MIGCLGKSLVLAVAASAQNPTWPPGPHLECAWDAGKLVVTWEKSVGPAPAPYPADMYEIGVSASAFAPPSAVYATSQLNASLDFLLPETTYFLSARAHAGWAFASSRGMGADTWGKSGPAKKCSTGAAASAPLPRASAEGGFVLESWRISEYASSVDYLLDHDGADAAGSSLLTTVLGQIEGVEGDLALHNAWIGGSTSEMTLTVYRVDALPPPRAGASTTRGDPRYADYASCNNQPDKSKADCTCAVAIDREWGRLPLALPECAEPTTGGACPNGTDCACGCDAASAATSAAYTGMMDIFAKDGDAPIGRWYSHPAATACRLHEPLGSKRADGTVCTWKEAAAARTIRGWQLYAAGLNTTNLACPIGDLASGGPKCAPYAAQVAENVAVMRRVLAAAPFAPWECDG